MSNDSFLVSKRKSEDMESLNSKKVCTDDNSQEQADFACSTNTTHAATMIESEIGELENLRAENSPVPVNYKNEQSELETAEQETEWLGTSRDMMTANTTLYELPPVKLSHQHWILFELPVKENTVPRPHPSNLDDNWISDYVRMPYSSMSLYPVKEASGTKGKPAPRWNMIEKALSKRFSNILELQTAIVSYNYLIGSSWDFAALRTLLKDLAAENQDAVFQNIISGMAQLALRLPSLVTQPVPLLKAGHASSLSLSQLQIASLLANAFFCTFPRRNSYKPDSEFYNYPEINFNRLLQGSRGQQEQFVEKLKCILNYFKRVTEKTPQGVVTFCRKVLGKEVDWPSSARTFTSLHINSSGTIEDDGQGMLQVDFANRFVGGGVLSHGCVQEEIRFVICPELIVSRLFVEALNDNEALVISGVERYNNYKGYSSSFEWIGDHKDTTTWDTSNRRCCSVVAIDAIPFREKHHQFKPQNLDRELNKAYAGFLNPNIKQGKSMPVATGNWGCGAFGGDALLKAVIQMMAAAEARRDIAYFTFGNKELMNDLFVLHSLIIEHQFTVGKIYRALNQYYNDYYTKGSFSCSLLKFLKAKLTPNATLPPQIHTLQIFARQNSKKKNNQQQSKDNGVKSYSQVVSSGKSQSEDKTLKRSEDIQSFLLTCERDELMEFSDEDVPESRPLSPKKRDTPEESFSEFWSPRVASSQEVEIPNENLVCTKSVAVSSTCEASSMPVVEDNRKQVLEKRLDKCDTPCGLNNQPKITNFFRTVNKPSDG